ncbi:MAG: DUF3313 domain-containing protein [Planctomycetes bacterium]|nr:DUF3313 domain-containing protein [Planctomycetota bacterium]
MRLLIVPLALVLSLGVGCKAKAAKSAGFVAHARMTKANDLPFHAAWRNPDGEMTRYSKIYIAPVDTSHLLEMDWWKQGESGAMADFKKDLDKIALDYRETLKQMYTTPPKEVTNRYTVVDQPAGKETLILEIAIVEIVPSKVTLEALSWAMPFGTGILLTPLNTSTAAIEGRFRDASTKSELLTFADREGEKSRPVDLAGFTWYSHANDIMKDWASQLVQVANQKPGEKIKDTKVYTLKPW